MLARVRWSTFGLRGRIVGAVLVTTIATLAVAAIVLLPRLESSLRKASKTTLVTDVTAARHDGDLHRLATVHYASINAIRPTAPKGSAAYAAQEALTDAAATQLKLLGSAENSLYALLGADQMTLVGYIDQSGQSGHPVFSGLAAGPAGQVIARTFPNIANSGVSRAFLTKKPVYHVGANDVRAAIPLIGDDAVLLVRKSIGDIPGAVAAVRRAFLVAALAGLVLTVLLAIPLAGTVVRRLQNLRQAALRIAVEGAVAEVPVDRARDEVGDLARSFAIMQRRLRHQEEARRAFVATASHELRTPLTSLDGMLELLAEDLREPAPDLADATDLLERARAQSRRLGRLAADLLDLSRIDADVALRSEPIELVELSRAVIAEFELASLDRGVNAALHEPATAVWALGDPGSIARILRILLDNALRVAPRGSEVNVRLSADPSPTLTVSDRGPGVAPEERALIFQRFQRGRDTGGEAGFGLGLAIGRELAERMSGALVLKETDEPGATFTLSLPAAHAPLEEPIPSAAQN
jgi:signal transduction histidine kinase